MLNGAAAPCLAAKFSSIILHLRVLAIAPFVDMLFTLFLTAGKISEDILFCIYTQESFILSVDMEQHPV